MVPAEMQVRHPMSATWPEQCNGLFDWTFINQAWMASYDIHSYRDWFLDADYSPMYVGTSPPAAAPPVAQPGPLGAQVPEAPAVARRVARRVSGCGLHLDAPLSCRGRRAIGPEPHQLHAADQHARLRPRALRARWAIIEELALHRGLATRDRDPQRRSPHRRRLPVVDARPGPNRRHSLRTPRHRCPTTRRAKPCSSGSTTTPRTSTACTRTWRRSSASTSSACAPASTSTRGGSCDLGRAHPRHRRDRHDRFLCSALHLAAENDVWGVARFADPAVRAKETFTAVRTPSPTGTTPMHDELAAAWVTLRAVDLARGNFGDLPDDFTYVLHLAWAPRRSRPPRGRFPCQRRRRGPRAPTLPQGAGRARHVGHGRCIR